MVTFAKSDHDYRLSKEESETLDKIKIALEKGDSNVLDSIILQLDLPMVGSRLKKFTYYSTIQINHGAYLTTKKYGIEEGLLVDILAVKVEHFLPPRTFRIFAVSVL